MRAPDDACVFRRRTFVSTGISLGRYVCRPSWIQGALVVSAAPACRADGPVTRVRIVARLDPRLPFVPGFLIAFVLKVAAPYIFRQVRSLPLPVRALALTGQLCGGYALLSAHAFGWDSSRHRLWR